MHRTSANPLEALWRQFLLKAKETYQTPVYFKALLYVILLKSTPDQAAKCEMQLERTFQQKFEHFLNEHHLLTADQQSIKPEYHQYIEASIYVDSVTSEPKVDSAWLPTLLSTPKIRF